MCSNSQNFVRLSVSLQLCVHTIRCLSPLVPEGQAKTGIAGQFTSDQIEYEVTFLLDGLAKFGFELWLRVLGKQATNLTLHSFFGFPLFYKIFSQGGKSFNRVKKLQGLMDKISKDIMFLV